MANHDPTTITSLAVARGENAAERMQHLVAVAQEVGGITITQVSGIDAEWFRLPAEELERQRRLDESVTRLLTGLSPPDRVRAIVDHFSEAGILTIRDVLVLGYEGIAHDAPQSINDQLDDVVIALEHKFPEEGGLLWEPTAADIAGFCFSLDQVTARVLPRYQSAIQRTPLRGERSSLRVGTIIDETDPRPVEQLGPSILQECRAEAYRFAAEFAAVGRDLNG